MSKVRTRYAPSPTGRMHVGNLRTALYAFLIAKHEDGEFLLRIEDTDQERYVEGAVEIIYRTLEETGLIHDEGPDKDGGVGPYVQSERQASGIYLEYAKLLVEKGGVLLLLYAGASGFFKADGGRPGDYDLRQALPLLIQGRSGGQSGSRHALRHPPE